MKKKLDPKLQSYHTLKAEECIDKTVCVTCLFKECGCVYFRTCSHEKQYKLCLTYGRAVDAIKKVLDKYDK